MNLLTGASLLALAKYIYYPVEDTSTFFHEPDFFAYRMRITYFILLREKFLQFDWLRAVVFQLNLKYLHVKITNLLRVVV